ncbi:MAG: EF-hand domain-containing protein [Chthoniobacteraceae bacterium]
MKILITTLSVFALATAFTTAQDKPDRPPGGPGGGGRGQRPNPEAMFKQLDKDNDGSVSLEEFKAGPMGQRNPERAEGAFKGMDKDSDGKLTLDEMKAARPHRPGGPNGGKHGKKPAGK